MLHRMFLLGFGTLALASEPPLFRLSSILGSHMVLEAENSRVWGFAPPGTEVNTTLSTHPLTVLATNADSSGVWRQALPSFAPGTTAYNLTFAAVVNGSAVELLAVDVLFGHVILCSGQSSEWLSSE